MPSDFLFNSSFNFPTQTPSRDRRLIDNRNILLGKRRLLDASTPSFIPSKRNTLVSATYKTPVSESTPGSDATPESDSMPEPDTTPELDTESNETPQLIAMPESETTPESNLTPESEAMPESEATPQSDTAPESGTPETGTTSRRVTLGLNTVTELVDEQFAESNVTQTPLSAALTVSTASQTQSKSG